MDTESVRSSYSHRSLASHVSYRSAYSQMARPPNSSQVIMGPGGPANQPSSRPSRHRPSGASGRRISSQQMQPQATHMFGPNTAPAANQQNGVPVQETRIESFSAQIQTTSYASQRESVDDDERALSVVAPADATKVRLLMEKPERSQNANGSSLYWNDSHTVITGATSDTALSFEDLRESGDEREEPSMGPKFHKIGCSRYCPTVFGAILCLLAFLTPVAMIILPTLGINEWTAKECTSTQCEGVLISMAVKLLLILTATLLIFFRHQTVTLPRVNVFKAVVLLIVSIVTFSYWLFYGVRIFQAKETDFASILTVASSFADVLLFLSFLAVVGLELKHLEPTFCLKIVRSPDGECRYITVGRVSIQRAASMVLQFYFRDFPYFNPFLESAVYRNKQNNDSSKGGKSATSYKFYDIDALSGPAPAGGSQAPSQTGKSSRAGSVVNGDVGNNAQSNGGSTRNSRFRRRGASHNDRFYSEEEYERRVRKRRARLIVASEEGFSHIRRLTSGQSEGSCRDTPQSGQPVSIAPRMEPHEAAQAIFPAIARPLEKYLSATRQQLRYTTDAVIEHLSACLANDLGPRAFLERYFQQEPSLYNDREYRPSATWLLASEALVSRSIGDGITFRLRPVENPNVYLMVTCRKLPHFNVLEEVLDSRNNKLTIRVANANSETSV